MVIVPMFLGDWCMNFPDYQGETCGPGSEAQQPNCVAMP
jgi:hypothetical protein